MARSIVLVMLCSAWVWAVELLPPDWGWDAPVAIGANDAGDIVVSSSSGAPRNTYLSCVQQNSDTVFTNLRLQAPYDQDAPCIVSVGTDIAVLIEQRTMSSSALLVKLVSPEGETRWVDTLLTGGGFGYPWLAAQIVRVGSKLLVTWRESGTSGQVLAQWLVAADGWTNGVQVLAIPQEVYAYDVFVYHDTTALVSGGGLLSELRFDSELITTELQRCYGFTSIYRDTDKIVVAGIVDGIVCGEVISFVSESFTFDLEPVQASPPWEVQLVDGLIAYRVDDDTLRVAVVGGSASPVTAGIGQNVHALHLVRGELGWGMVWRNAGDSSVWGNQIDSLGSPLTPAGDSLLAFVGFAGLVPLGAYGIGDHGWFLAIASNGSLTVRPIGQVSTASPGRPMPVPFEVSLSVFPNPFNPSTNIHFAVPTFGPVVVEVYDLLGKNIGRLIDGPLPAGSYMVPWNPSAASGTYFVSLTTPLGRAVERVYLVR